MPSQISAVIITFNEEEYIRQCIVSIQPVADEIIVIDSFSTDETLRICEDLGVRVYQKKWEGYAATKNWGNEQATFPFILSVDADEQLSPELIKNLLRHKEVGLDAQQVYSFNRLNNYCGMWMKYAGWYPDTKVRLFSRENTLWQGEVHETLSFHNPVKVVHIEGDIWHYSIKDKEDHIRRERKYASLAIPYKSSIKGYISAMAKFIKMFIIKRGFLAGKLGFQLSIISAKAKIWRIKKP